MSQSIIHSILTNKLGWEPEPIRLSCEQWYSIVHEIKVFQIVLLHVLYKSSVEVSSWLLHRVATIIVSHLIHDLEQQVLIVKGDHD